MYEDRASLTPLAGARRRLAALTIALAAAAAFSLARCGRDDTKKKPQPDAPASNLAPTSWDGAQDWADSALKVVDE